MPNEEKEIQESDNTGPEEENRENFPERPPVPLYTVILLACIAAVVGAQMRAELPAGLPLTEIFFHQFTKTAYLAGFWKPVFLEDREYWRILTGVVLHGFLVHALMNSYVFYMFGKLFEFLSSRAHLAIVFLLSALGGSLLSLFFRPDGLSVGASGGILGLVSYLAVYAFRRRQLSRRRSAKAL